MKSSCMWTVSFCQFARLFVAACSLFRSSIVVNCSGSLSALHANMSWRLCLLLFSVMSIACTAWLICLMSARMTSGSVVLTALKSFSLARNFKVMIHRFSRWYFLVHSQRVSEQSPTCVSCCLLDAYFFTSCVEVFVADCLGPPDAQNAS